MLKKLIKISFIAVLIIGLIIGTYKITNVSSPQDDTLEKILKEDNYPFNGYYSPNTTNFNEKELKEKLLKIDGIKSHVENLEINLISNDTINVSCKLKEISKLLNSQKELSSYATWGKTFEGQNITAVLAIEKADTGGTDLKIKSAKVGNISIDPQLITPLISSSNTVKSLQKIPYESIKCECGVITFSDQVPQELL